MPEIVNQQNVGLKTREMSTNAAFSDEKAARANMCTGCVCQRARKTSQFTFITEVTLLLLLLRVSELSEQKLTVPPGGGSHQKRQACEQV